jgi:hypothetical protein
MGAAARSTAINSCGSLDDKLSFYRRLRRAIAAPDEKSKFQETAAMAMTSETGILGTVFAAHAGQQAAMSTDFLAGFRATMIGSGAAE